MRRAFVEVPVHLSVGPDLASCITIREVGCCCCPDGRICCEPPNCCSPQQDVLFEMRLMFELDLGIDGDRAIIREVRALPEHAWSACARELPPFELPPDFESAELPEPPTLTREFPILDDKD